MTKTRTRHHHTPPTRPRARAPSGFCERFSTALERRGLTQSDLSRASAVPLRTIQRLLAFEPARFSKKTIATLADALGVSAGWLVFP